jgi:hypothetical protein
MFCGRLRRDRQNRTFSAGPNPELTYSPYDLTDETTGAAAAIVIPKRYMMIVRLKHLASTNGEVIRAYLSMIGGSAGRLVISLVYFIAIANTLSISEFGLFATASACGIMLSRLMAFGFVSPLYRIATVKTRLLGVYTAGFLGGWCCRTGDRPCGLADPCADLHRPDGACDLCKDHRGRSAVLADHGDRGHRQLRYQPLRLGVGAGGGGHRAQDHRGRALCLAGGCIACDLGLVLPRRQWPGSVDRDPVLLSTGAAALETGALHQAMGRRGLGGRCGNAVLHPVGTRQGAGALARRTRNRRDLRHHHAAGRPHSTTGARLPDGADAKADADLSDARQPEEPAVAGGRGGRGLDRGPARHGRLPVAVSQCAWAPMSPWRRRC